MRDGRRNYKRLDDQPLVFMVLSSSSASILLFRSYMITNVFRWRRCVVCAVALTVVHSALKVNLVDIGAREKLLGMRESEGVRGRAEEERVGWLENR